jgi:hypothetical protein
MNSNILIDEYIEDVYDSDVYETDEVSVKHVGVINDFLFNYSYESICFLEDLKNKFALNPGFLCKSTGVKFIHFITDYLYNSDNSGDLYTKNLNNYDYFKHIYKNELYISYSLFEKYICKILRKNKLYIYDKWVYFCYINSELHDII